MTRPFVGEIQMFAGNFAPAQWAFCDGQLMAISQNQELFAVLTTIYGGDGRTTFGLPDLRGRIPVHAGSGPGLSPRQIGAKGGAERVRPTVNQLPRHDHDGYHASTLSGNQSSPAGNLAAGRIGDRAYRDGPAEAKMSEAGVTMTGGRQDHDNVMPFMCINYIIALTGVFPERN